MKYLFLIKHLLCFFYVFHFYDSVFADGLNSYLQPDISSQDYEKSLCVLENLDSLSRYTGKETLVYVKGRQRLNDGYQGFFELQKGDFCSVCTLDNLHGVYVPRMDLDTSLGAWVRIDGCDGQNGRPEWFYDGSGDWTYAFQAAINLLPGYIRLSSKKYSFDGRSPIIVKSDRIIQGVGASSDNGTVLYYTGVTGPFFRSDPDGYVSFFSMKDICLISARTPGQLPSNQDCFELYGVTNNSRFDNVFIRNFGGNAWNIFNNRLQKDKTSCGNVVFSQCFVVSCGKFAWNISGYVNALWYMPDINSPQQGGWCFSSGSNNQSIINIFSPWFEGTRPWSSKIAISLIDGSNQLVNIVGGNFVCASGSGTMINIDGKTGAHVNLVGVVGYGWDNIINDHVRSTRCPWKDPISFYY